MRQHPVILGMNNPHSTDPRHALAPYPERVAGWRLWSFLNDVSPTPRMLYMTMTDRRNLLSSRTWDAAAARSESDGLWESLEGRTVLVLGESVRRVLWLNPVPPLLWNERGGVRWCLIPHPSGLNRWYNDPLNRLVVGLRLEELIHG